MASKSSQQYSPGHWFFLPGRTHLHRFFLGLTIFYCTLDTTQMTHCGILDPLFLSKSNICSDSLLSLAGLKLQTLSSLLWAAAEMTANSVSSRCIFAGNLRASPVFERFKLVNQGLRWILSADLRLWAPPSQHSPRTLTVLPPSISALTPHASEWGSLGQGLQARSQPQ